MDRAKRLCDRLIVAVLNNAQKRPLFNTDERVEMLRACTANRPGVEVMAFDGLLMDFARAQNASFVVRGLRALSDFEAELAMASMNKRIAPEIETVFLMTSPKWSYLSSSMIKEVARYGGDIDALVCADVARRTAEKFRI